MIHTRTAGVDFEKIKLDMEMEIENILKFPYAVTWSSGNDSHIFIVNIGCWYW